MPLRPGAQRAPGRDSRIEHARATEYIRTAASYVVPLPRHGTPYVPPDMRAPLPVVPDESDQDYNDDDYVLDSWLN